MKRRINRILMLKTPGLSHPFMQRVRARTLAIAPNAFQKSVINAGPADGLLEEAGDFLLTEDGDYLILE